jgi:DNA repair protein RadA/Sms
VAGRVKTVFICQACSYESAKWLGRCPECGGWNTFLEERADPQPSKQGPSRPVAPAAARPVLVSDLKPGADGGRTSTGMAELDRVLGGGIVRGELVLIGGDPGIGKSTLVLQMADFLSAGNGVLYVSGEESPDQIALRAERLDLRHRRFHLFNETNILSVLDAVDSLAPGVLIVDSIQTVWHPEMQGAAGSVGQIREITAQLMTLAKARGIAVFIIGHITKEGAIAGPKVLEHMVDCVLYFEGERHGAFRLLRAVKNRFGATNEIGVFEMREKGLAEVKDASGYFLAERQKNSVGTALSVVMEGTRPLMVEVQALSAFSAMAMPRRVAAGLDYNRLSLIAAVLDKLGGLSLRNQEVYVKITGGLKVDEPAVDLAVAVAVAGSFRNRPVEKDIIFLGEVGLNGFIRPVSHLAARVREAEKLGFTEIMVPEAGSDLPASVRPSGLTRVRHVNDAIAAVLGRPGGAAGG